MTLVPASSHGGGGGPANVSADTIIQTGSGSPLGAVVPTQTGAMYQDLSRGAWYAAVGPTNADWTAVGGNGSQDATGVYTQANGVLLAMASGAASRYAGLTDVLANNGNGGGVYWHTHGADGTQDFTIVLGSTAQFVHSWNTNGSVSLAGPLGTAPAAPATKALASGTGARLSTTADVESHTPVTFNPGVATTATCKVEISPDNSTYTELATITKPVGTVFDGEIDDVVVRVPAGWYIRLTVNAQATIGTTTYY